MIVGCGEPPAVTNEGHRHAFVLTGGSTLFAVHMTQYYDELHKYQIILRIGLSEIDAGRLAEERAEHPDATFVLCNAKDDPFSIPQLGGGTRTGFTGNIFHGQPPLPEHPGPHFFPWDRQWCRPMIGDVPVTVERVVLYRPFLHHEPPPAIGTYWLWGEGSEAHMTNLQTAPLAPGAFEGPAFGPGYDHVMQRAAAPHWLDPDLLRAGIPVTAPDLKLVDPATGRPDIPAAPPFPAGVPIRLLYRGTGPAYEVVAGPTWLCCGDVCNSPEANPRPGACTITPMPKRYLEGG